MHQALKLSRAWLHLLPLVIAVAFQMHPTSASNSGLDCRSGSPREVINAAELIFAGRLIAEHKDETNGALTISTLAVALRWKGPPFQFVEITSSLRSPSPFDATQPFLISANSRSTDRWYLSVCCPRALPLNIAGEYLEALGEPAWQFR